MIKKICWHCDIEDEGEGYIIETDEFDWICKDCLYDRRIGYYDIEKAKERLSALCKEFRIGSD